MITGIFALSVFLLSGSTAANGDWKACFDQPTNLQIGQCLIEVLNSLEDDLESAVALTKRNLSPKEMSAFDRAHAAWEEYRRFQCEFAGIMLEGARMRSFEEATCKMTLTEKRLDDVRAINVQHRFEQPDEPEDSSGASPRDSTKLVDLIGDKLSITILEFKQYEPNDYCEEFSIEPVDVEFFFLNATIVDGYVYDSAYAFFPCTLTGKLESQGIVYEWVISPAGKGSLKAAGRDRLYLMCDGPDRCRKIFPEGGKVHE